MFDGWTNGSIHNVGVFATYIYDGQYHESLIACAPLLNEGDLSSRDYVEFIIESLSVYEKSIDNVLCFIGDNCATNQCIARLTGKPLVGCASHKLNLAIECWTLEQSELEDAIKKLRELMTQLRTVKNSAKLRELTQLGAILPNVTRWNGKYEMIIRFFKIEKCLQSIESLDKHLPRPSHRRALEKAIPHFENFSSVTVNLQK